MEKVSRANSPDVPVRVDAQDRAPSAEMAGPWWTDFAGYVWAPSAKGGQFSIAQVRGWGYYTGHGQGALGLSEDEGIKRQAQVGWLIQAAPDLFAACVALQAEAHVRGFGLRSADEAIDKALGRIDSEAIRSPTDSPHTPSPDGPTPGSDLSPTNRT